MASILTEDQEEIVKNFLEDINRQKLQHDKNPISSKTAIKFLMARKFDLKRAVELYYSHEIMREREDLINIDPLDSHLQKELHTEKFTILPGRDIRGASLALFSARHHIPPRTTHQFVLKALLHQLDAALESVETQRNGIVFIYDMTDSKYANFDYDLSIKILNMLKGGYPARLKKVLIVTAPMWFKAPFKILRLFVREKLRDRVYTVNLSQLALHIPRDSLPKSLGGNLVINHVQWLELCYRVSMDQFPDMSTYFITRVKSNSRSDQLSRGSFSQVSSDGDSMLISDMDSEGSKETISEKHNHEEKEKFEDGLDGNDIEKEVNVEKDGPDSNQSVTKRLKATDGKPDSRKRVSNNSDEITEDKQSSSLPHKKRPSSSGSSTNIYEIEDSIHTNDKNGIDLNELVEYVRTLRKRGLFEDYARIKMEPPPGTFSISKSRVNLPKNRYTDVLCFDHSRVVLPLIDGDATTDYINANYVDGYMQRNAYISTQGPLPKTFGDFWRMVWYNHSMVVVMTTKTVERGRMKCGQYWPNEEEMEEQFEEFILYNTGIEQHKDYIVTGLALQNTKTGEYRQITHLQFTSWPDYGVPHCADGFLDFLFRVRACQAEATKAISKVWHGHPNGPPVVVHCSAGIGRTGTFITININIQRLEHIGTVDVRETVRRIRSQRAFSIQMPDQYVFCHLGLIEHAKRQSLLENVDLSGFYSESDSD